MVFKILEMNKHQSQIKVNDEVSQADAMSRRERLGEVGFNFGLKKEQSLPKKSFEGNRMEHFDEHCMA